MFLHRIFRPHHICVAYRCNLYLAMFMVCLSVCLSVCESVSLSVVGHADVLWQNGWTDQDAVWHMGWGGRQSPCIRWGFGSPPTGMGNFGVVKGPSHSKV